MATKTVQSSYVRWQFGQKPGLNQPQFPPDNPLLLTWRLQGSLPPMTHAVSDKIQKLPGRARQLRIEKRLDAAKHGPAWLGDARIAPMVCEEIEKGETEFQDYKLHAYVVKPNDVHMLVTPTGDFSYFMGKLKGVTARQANLILGRTGQTFWQNRSFDRFSRD
ncbi:MAG: transposase [Candidatus Acidiferrales bacterium]